MKINKATLDLIPTGDCLGKWYMVTDQIGGNDKVYVIDLETGFMHNMHRTIVVQGLRLEATEVIS